MLKYFVVLDFEATCDELNAPNPQEVIEFPSVLVDATSLTIIDEFQEYVKPVHHPKLREFCTKLTGIEQETIDPAQSFPSVLQNHQTWLKSHKLSLDEPTNEVTWAFVSCGDWDLGTMLPTQLTACIPPIKSVPQCYRRWINIKRPFSEVTNIRGAGMAGMLKELNLTLDGRHHSGIDDCKNISKIVIELSKHKALQITCQTALSRYPVVTINVSYNGERKELVLRKRSIKTLLGLASGAFRKQMKVCQSQLSDGTTLDINSDDDLRQLADGDIIVCC